MALVVEVLESSGGFIAAGVGSDGRAPMVFLTRALRSLRAVRLPVESPGEVSEVLAFGDKLIALSSHKSGEGYVHLLSRSGDVQTTQRLRGGAVTGVVVAKDGGLVVTYRAGNEVFVERLDQSLKSVWLSKLHDVGKGVSRKARMLDVPKGLVWVGGNNGRLMVYRLNPEGRVVEQAADEVSGFGLPIDGMYNAVVVGSAVHIRGVGIKASREPNLSGSFEPFHFVDQPR